MNATRSTRSLLLVTAIAVASQIISACYPWSHEYTSRPEISGVLLRGGAPSSGTRVMVVHTGGDDGNFCRDAKAVASTDEAGRFHIDAVTRLHFFTSILNPPNYVAEVTSVCFDVPGQRTFGVLLMAPTNRTVSYSLSCDFDSPPREFKQHVIWQKDKWGICGNGS